MADVMSTGDGHTVPIDGYGAAPCPHHAGLPFTENWLVFVRCPDCSTWSQPPTDGKRSRPGEGGRLLNQISDPGAAVTSIPTEEDE